MMNEPGLKACGIRYHDSEDLSDREGYDFEQVAAIARVIVSTPTPFTCHGNAA